MTYTHFSPIKFISTAIVLLLSTLTVSATDSLEALKNFNQRLNEGCTPEDSITVMTNIFDIYQAQGYKTDSIAREIIDISMRQGDYETTFDMLRQRANALPYNIDSLNNILIFTSELPEHPRKNETMTFVQMVRNSYYTYNADDKEREDRFSQKLREFNENQSQDIYDQISILHAICLHLANNSRGELMVEYFDRLGELIDQLPEDVISLRNIYQVQSALAFSVAGQPEKAIKADQNLLEIINQLKSYYEKEGRPYRNYNANKYIIYNRLLSNFNSLPHDSVESYYQKALYYKDIDQRAKNAYDRFKQPEIFHAMANEDYERIYSLLKDLAFVEVNHFRRVQFMEYLIKGAEAVGDKATMLRASLDLNQHLKSMLELSGNDQELRVLYETYTARESLAQKEAERQADVNRLQRAIIVICLVALAGLILLLFFLVRQYRKSRHLANTLVASNEALKSESTSLRASQKELSNARDAAEKANQFKTDFIKNMRHEINVPLNAITEYSRLISDCADASKRKYLDRYAELVKINGELLTTIINDVFHLSEIDSNTVRISRKLVDMRKLCELSLDSVRNRAHKGVEIQYDPDSDNIELVTDPRRVRQIIINVLSNSVKYTDRGFIRLKVNYTDDQSQVKVTITDSGIGIPAEQHEHIFERFVKLDPDAQGIGLGLPISRMLARLLGGELELDTEYRRGARFVLTLPVEMKATI